METYIHRVVNQTNKLVHLMLFSDNISLSYDLVLDPLESCSYDELIFDARAPVPAATNAIDFQKNRIRLLIGSDVYSIYQYRGQTRLASGDAFQADAPPIAPYSAGGSVDLILGGGKPQMVLLTKPEHLLDSNCGEHFTVSEGYVYFQGGLGRSDLYKVKVDGTPGTAIFMNHNCGKMVVHDGYVYFQGGRGKNSLLRMGVNDGPGTASRMDVNCGDFVIPGDGYVYFQGNPRRNSLFKMKVDGKAGSATLMDENCGGLAVSAGYVFFLGNPLLRDLFRMTVGGKSGSATLIYPHVNWLVAPGNGYVYFRGDNVQELRRMKVDGSPGSDTVMKYLFGSHLVVAGDHIYFEGGVKPGLYRMKADGEFGSETMLSENCGRLAVPGDGYVYYESYPSSGDLMRVKIQGIGPPKILTQYRGKFVIADRYAYYQGGADRNSLVRMHLRS